MFTRQREENDFRPQIRGPKCNSQFDPQVVESMFLVFGFMRRRPFQKAFLRGLVFFEGVFDSCFVCHIVAKAFARRFSLG